MVGIAFAILHVMKIAAVVVVAFVVVTFMVAITFMVDSCYTYGKYYIYGCYYIYRWYNCDEIGQLYNDHWKSSGPVKSVGNAVSQCKL